MKHTNGPARFRDIDLCPSGLDRTRPTGIRRARRGRHAFQIFRGQTRCRIDFSLRSSICPTNHEINSRLRQILMESSSLESSRSLLSWQSSTFLSRDGCDEESQLDTADERARRPAQQITLGQWSFCRWERSFCERTLVSKNRIFIY